MPQKQRKIIDAALSLFVKNGIHNTSMQNLAKQAGIATGSIYNYFDSKETLVVEIFHTLVAESIATITINYDSSQPVKNKFYYLMQQQIQFNIKNPDKFRFFGMCAYEPIVMQAVKSNDHQDSPLANVLRQGKDENLLKDLSVQDIFYFLFSGIASLIEWRLFNHQNISDNDISNMVDMAWDSIRK